MRLRSLACVGTGCLLLAAADARADGLFTASIGATINRDADRNTLTYGLAIGAVGGLFGIELDFGYTPDFLGEADLIDNNVATIMANLLVGPRAGAIQPYATAGMGILRTKISSPRGLLDLGSTDFGVNVGGGLLAFFSRSVGFRGDVRYFRSAAKEEGLLDFALGTINFWRVNGGLALRF